MEDYVNKIEQARKMLVELGLSQGCKADVKFLCMSVLNKSTVLSSAIASILQHDEDTFEKTWGLLVDKCTG